MASKDEKPARLVMAAIYILGISAMLPWNFFITADKFWQYKLRNVTLDDDPLSTNTSIPSSRLQLSFMPSLVIISNVFFFIFLNVTSWIVTRVGERVRVSCALGLMLVVMSAITVLACVNTDQWQMTFYVIVMVMVGVLNMFNGVFHGTLYGMVGRYHSSCTSALSSGMALAGLVSCGSRLLALAVGEANPITSGIVYFALAVAFLMLALVMYWVMVFRDDRRRSESLSELPQDGGSAVAVEDLQGVTEVADGEVAAAADAPMLPAEERQQQVVIVGTKSAVDIKDEDAEGFGHLVRTYWRVVKKIWWLGFTVAITLLITLSIYPVVLVYVTSTSPSPGPWRDVYFQPTVTFLLFNIGDVIGRELPRWVKWPRARGWQLPVAGCSRLVLVALLMLCHGTDKSFPTLFYSDVFYMVFNVLFAASGGFIGTLTLVHYPQLVNADEVPLAGSIMGAMMGAGMVTGSLISPAMVALWGPKTH